MLHQLKLLTLMLMLATALMPGLTWCADGDTIRRGLGPEPDSLDIHQAQGLSSINLLRDLREGLVTFNAAGEPVPGQAAEWRILDGGLTYRFRIRPGAKWSNGERVLASDFVRAWRRAFDPTNTAATAGLLKDVLNAQKILSGNMKPDQLGIYAVQDNLLEIRLETPAPWILEILAHPVSYPLHSEDIEDPLRAPVNGAYLLADWVPRANVRLQRNPQYHSWSLVKTAFIEYFPIDDPPAELSRYRAGELHISETIPAGRFEWLRENLPADLRISPYLGSFWLGINLKHPTLGQSVNLRRALALAINRDILVEKVLGAGELPAFGFVPPGMAGYQPASMPEQQWSQQRREAEAQRLLRESGLVDDEALRIELRYNTSSVHRRMAVAVAAMWKQVLGIHSQLVNEEWKVFVNNRRLGIVTEVFRGGWIADYADPTSFLELFLGDSNLNATFYDRLAYDKLLQEAAVATGNDRMNLLAQAESQLIQDMPAIPLYYYVSRHLVRPEVRGFVDNVRDIHLSRYLALEATAP